MFDSGIILPTICMVEAEWVFEPRKRELPVLSCLTTPARRYYKIKNARHKVQETKATLSIPGNFWQFLVVAGDGIS